MTLYNTLFKLNSKYRKMVNERLTNEYRLKSLIKI